MNLTPKSNDGKKNPDLKRIETDSGIPVDLVCTARPTQSELGAPGEFPFSRGIYPDMYRKRLWTMRQYTGFGTAHDTNKRFKYLMSRGQTGLSVAFDLPTQLGLDSDSSRAEGEVGKVGVAISTLDNMKELFDGIPVGQVSTSMTINATASTMLTMYVAAAESRGIPRAELRGTVQNDILKEYAARNTYIYPPENSLSLSLDIIEFCAKEMPKWHPISISGYHIREAGANAIQELSFTFADAIEYVNGAINRELPIDSFCSQLSFFFACRNDFFEEIAKFRAARRIWANIVKNRFGSRNEDSMKLKFHVQTSGETLTAQQPLNNVVRVSTQALAAILGGAQSLHTNSYDEALGLPSEEAATIALRTQQIIADETGVIGTSDPIGGSYYLENLTSEIESRALEELEKIQRLGGALEAIKSGYVQREIQKSAYEFQKAVDTGEKVIVGVNKFDMDASESFRPQNISPKSVSRQLSQLKKIKRERSKLNFEKAISKLQDQASKDTVRRQNLVPFILDAVKQGATTGEVSNALRSAYGEYHSQIEI
ncbi:MAG: methylmalonyl-CoA mutase family protein [Thaumarchaeota archaeon]|nr:methylmalonyl-CoA mutase family protein [Nitrososphaerota archaeon]